MIVRYKKWELGKKNDDDDVITTLLCVERKLNENYTLDG